MAAGKLNIIIEQGATFTRQLTLIDALGTPINLATISEVRGVIRTHWQDDTISGAFTFVLETPLVDGIVSMTMDVATTTALNPGVQKYDVEVVETDATVVRLLEGDATITANITRT